MFLVMRLARLAFFCVAATVLLGARGARACDQARYMRLFPLGRAGDAIVALELRQFRKPEDGTWQIRSRLVALRREKRAGNNTAVWHKPKELATFPKVKSADSNDAYVAAMRRTFAKALAGARKLPGFTEAQVSRHWNCGYTNKKWCGQFRFRAQFREPFRGTFAYRRGKRVKSLLLPGNPYPSSPEEKYAGELAAVRTLVIGSHSYAVVSMSNGSYQMSACGESVPVKKCRAGLRPQRVKTKAAISESLYNQSPLWHGDDYDFLLQLDWREARDRASWRANERQVRPSSRLTRTFSGTREVIEP